MSDVIEGIREIKAVMAAMMRTVRTSDGLERTREVSLSRNESPPQREWAQKVVN